MAIMLYREAVNLAIREEMRRDVIYLLASHRPTCDEHRRTWCQHGLSYRTTDRRNTLEQMHTYIERHLSENHIMFLWKEGDVALRGRFDIENSSYESIIKNRF